MDGTPAPSYRTELTAYIADLTVFIEEKIGEAERDPASRAAALSEAAGAFPVIRDRLLREDQTIHTKFMLLGVFEMDFERLASMQSGEFAAAIDDMRKRIEAARAVLQSA